MRCVGKKSNYLLTAMAEVVVLMMVVVVTAVAVTAIVGMSASLESSSRQVS